jgi:hypothetical protein
MLFALVAASHLAWLPAALALVPLGPDFQVNTYTTDNQWFPAVAVDDDGNFVVVWQSDGSPGSDSSDESIQVQRYDAAGIPQGGQSQVNTSTNSFQVFPAVAAQGSLLPPNPGGFVVVWWDSSSPTTDNGSSIQGRRYDSAGIPQGSQFQVNTYTTGAQQLPHVAADAAGNFVVVWESKVTIPFTPTPPGSIQGQRYDAAGVPQGAEFQVNSFTTVNVDQISAAVAADAAGNFVVVWKSEYPYGLSHRIRARRFDAGGTPQGPDFQVDNVTSGRPQDPAVAMDAAGIFVVVWPSTFDYGEFSEEGSGIQARRYDASGNPQGGQFQVNTYTTGVQDRPQVAASAAGDFIVVWESGGSAGSDTNGPSIQGQRYDAAGAPFGIEFQVNSHTAGAQQFPAIAAGTGVVAAWLSSSSAGSDTSGGSIQARRFLLPDTTTTSSTSSTSTTATSTTSTTTLPTVELLPGRVTTIKPGTLAKFVAKPATGDAFPLPTAASMAAGGSLRVFDTAATAGDQTFTLPAIGWISLGPGGSNGYKYRGAGSIGDPCKVVLVRERVVKGMCRGTGVTLAPPFAGDVGINLTVGASHIFTYCARFGGSEGRNDATLTTRRNAPAPGACP